MGRKGQQARLTGSPDMPLPYYLIWFENCDVDYMYNIQELCSIFEMEIITTFTDGAIYLVK